MRLRLEGPLDSEEQLDCSLGEDDRGRTWWIGYCWHIWTGRNWLRAIASTKVPPGAP